MTLRFKTIHDRMNIERERIVFRAEAEFDIGSLMLVKSQVLANDRIAGGKLTHVYWIPDKRVNEGDLVIIYSKSGSQSEKQTESGTSHFFYWGLSAPCWDNNSAAVVMDLGGWTVNPVVSD